MKKIIILIIILFMGGTILTGCVTRSFYYDFDELMEGLVKAEIIYMEESVTFFSVHSYIGVREDEYEVRKELTPEEGERLVRSLSRIRFTYSMLLLPHSTIHSMEGYAIKLTYGSSYIIVAQTGDYRSAFGRMSRLPQSSAGRRATDEDWNRLITEGFMEEGVSFAPLIRIGIGLGFLMFFTVLLVVPYLGWDYMYDASTSKITVEIPKAKKYSLNIRRKRAWFLKEQGNLSYAFPKVAFLITKMDTGESIKFVPTLSMLRSKGGGRITIPVGYFQVPSPGDYLIESSLESQFIQGDEILIRRYINTTKQWLYIVGIAIGGGLLIHGVLPFFR